MANIKEKRKVDKKKTKAPRDYISPSDLTFLWSECKKCFWLKYNEGISRPGFMPLIGPMSAFQEKLYRERPTRDLAFNLAPGVVSNWGETIESVPLNVNGKPSKWRIKGKYDIVITFDDGRIGLIDCKVTSSEMDESKVDLYWPQLEAYVFALENPLNGEGKIASETGLLMWQISGANTDHIDQFIFTTNKLYLSAGRNPKKFETFITEVIEVLDGAMPESGSACPSCKFVEKRIKV